MTVKSENYSFLKSWSDIYVDEYERTSSVMSDYHAHDYFEVSLILSGDVRVLVPGVSHESDKPRAVLCAPGVPHCITCTEGTRYRRINVIFSEEFVSSSRESDDVIGVFKREGSIIPICESDAEALADIARMLSCEKNRFRQRLLLLYFLSRISDFDGESANRQMPPYVSNVLTYVKENYSEKILSEELAKRVNVGRTTLMTGFKKYTGMTIGEYVLKCRLIASVELLLSGVSERECAELTGFGESSSLIRSFKRHFGITPQRYLAVLRRSRNDYT